LPGSPWDLRDHTRISHRITRDTLGLLGPHWDQPWDLQDLPRIAGATAG